MRSASGGAKFAAGLPAAGAGLLTVICVALALSGLVLALLVPDEALSVPPDLRPRTTALPLAMLSYAAVGAFIAAVQPRNPIGWIFCAVALMWELFFFGSGYTQYAVFASSMPLPGLTAIALLMANLWIVSGALIAIALLLFPDGRLLSSRWRVLPVLVAALTAFIVFVISVSPGGVPNRPYIPNPIGVPGTAAAIRFLSHDAFIVAWAITYALAVASLLVRYRRSGDVHRQQLKWIAFAGTGLVVVLLSMQAIVESPLKTLDPAAQRRRHRGLPREWLQTSPARSDGLRAALLGAVHQTDRRWHRDRALPPMRHRPNHQAHPRVRHNERGGRGHLLRGYHRGAGGVRSC